MRTSLLLFLAVLTMNIAKTDAQIMVTPTLETAKDSVTLDWDPVLELWIGKTYLRNLTSDSVRVRWSTDGSTYPGQWTPSFCYFNGGSGLCIDIERPFGDTIFWLAPNDSSEVKMQVQDNDFEAGIGDFDVRFDDLTNPGSNENTFYKLDLGPVAVRSLDRIEVDAYPNPVVDRLTVQGLDGFSGRLGLYNMLGKRVIDVSLNGQNGVVLNTEALSQGIYLLRLFNATNDEVYAQPIQRVGR